MKFVLLDLSETLASVDWSPILIAREAAAARIDVSPDVLHAACERTLPGRMLGRHGGEPGAALPVDDAQANLDAAALGLAGCRMDRMEPSPGGPYAIVSDMTGLLRLIG